MVLRKLGKMVIQRTGTPHSGVLEEGTDRQWTPELQFGAGVQEENEDRPLRSWDRGEGQGDAGLGRAEVWSGEPQ